MDAEADSRNLDARVEAWLQESTGRDVTGWNTNSLEIPEDSDAAVWEYMLSKRTPEKQRLVGEFLKKVPSNKAGQYYPYPKFDNNLFNLERDQSPSINDCPKAPARETPVDTPVRAPRDIDSSFQAVVARASVRRKATEELVGRSEAIRIPRSMATNTPTLSRVAQRVLDHPTTQTPQPSTSAASRHFTVPSSSYNTLPNAIQAAIAAELDSNDQSINNFQPVTFSTPHLSHNARPMPAIVNANGRATTPILMAPPATKLGSVSKIPIFAQKLCGTNRGTPSRGPSIASPSIAALAIVPSIKPNNLNGLMGASRVSQPPPLETVTELTGARQLESNAKPSAPISINVYNVHNGSVASAPPAAAIHKPIVANVTSPAKIVAVAQSPNAIPIPSDTPASGTTFDTAAPPSPQSPKSPLAERTQRVFTSPHIRSAQSLTPLLIRMKPNSEHVLSGKENTLKSANNSPSSRLHAPTNNGTYDVPSRRSSIFRTRTMNDSELNEHTLLPANDLTLNKQRQRKTYTICSDPYAFPADDGNDDDDDEEIVEKEVASASATPDKIELTDDADDADDETVETEMATPDRIELTDDQDDEYADADTDTDDANIGVETENAVKDGQYEIADPREPLEPQQRLNLHKELNRLERPDEAQLEIFNLSERQLVSDEEQLDNLGENVEVANDTAKEPKDQGQLERGNSKIKQTLPAVQSTEQKPSRPQRKRNPVVVLNRVPHPTPKSKRQSSDESNKTVRKSGPFDASQPNVPVTPPMEFRNDPYITEQSPRAMLQNFSQIIAKKKEQESANNAQISQPRISLPKSRRKSKAVNAEVEEVERIVETFINNSSTDSGSQPSNSQRQKRELYHKGRSLEHDEKSNEEQTDSDATNQKSTTQNGEKVQNTAASAKAAATADVLEAQRSESPVYDKQSEGDSTSNVSSKDAPIDLFDALKADTSTNNPLLKSTTKPGPNRNISTSDSDDDYESADGQSEQSAQPTAPAPPLNAINIATTVQHLKERFSVESPTGDMESLHYETDASLSHRVDAQQALNNDDAVSSEDGRQNAPTKSTKKGKTGNWRKSQTKQKSRREPSRDVKRSVANETQNKSKRGSNKSAIASKEQSLQADRPSRNDKTQLEESLSKASSSGVAKKSTAKSQKQATSSTDPIDADIDSEIELNSRGKSNALDKKKRSDKKANQSQQSTLEIDAQLQKERKMAEKNNRTTPNGQLPCDEPTIAEPVIEQQIISGHPFESSDEGTDYEQSAKQSFRSIKNKSRRSVAGKSKSKRTRPHKKGSNQSTSTQETAARSPRPVRNKPKIQYWKTNDHAYIANELININQLALAKAEQNPSIRMGRKSKVSAQVRRKTKASTQTNGKRAVANAKTNRTDEAGPSKRKKSMVDTKTPHQKWFDDLCDPNYDINHKVNNHQIDLRYYMLENGSRVEITDDTHLQFYEVNNIQIAFIPAFDPSNTGYMRILPHTTKPKSITENDLTLHVLRGKIRLILDDKQIDLWHGRLVIQPNQSYSIENPFDDVAIIAFLVDVDPPPDDGSDDGSDDASMHVEDSDTELPF